MRITSARVTLLLIVLLATVFTSSHRTLAKPVLPNPVLYLKGQEFFTKDNKDFIRYVFDVDNKDAYPADFFAASPNLPACGKNPNSSRTWVDIFDQSGQRLYGFCALGKPADLNGIWFALEVEKVPPSYIYIELNDRKTSTKYKSNLADTSL